MIFAFDTTFRQWFWYPYFIRADLHEDASLTFAALVATSRSGKSSIILAEALGSFREAKAICEEDAKTRVDHVILNDEKCDTPDRAWLYKDHPDSDIKARYQQRDKEWEENESERQRKARANWEATGSIA